MKRRCFTLIVVTTFLVFARVADAKPPSWDTVTSSGRLRVLKQFNDEAVFDKETGLVWERSPDATPQTWFNALSFCYQREVGGRKGWRLPTIEELASLVDTSQPAPTLPAGHPFDNVGLGFYGSATTDAGNTASAWGVGFSSGGLGIAAKVGSGFFVWCVRGGQGIDGL